MSLASSERLRPSCDHHRKHLQSRQQAVAGGGFLQEHDVPRLFPAEDIAAFTHRLDHVAIADGRAQQLALLGGQGALETEVGHHRRHHGVARQSALRR